jgi:FtsZ-interacting cell division protein ZipA
MGMRRLLIIVGALAVLAAPATASAAKPSKADRREAQKECRELRGTTDATREAFKAQYRNFGACVSEKAREANAERKAARRAAKQACQDEKPRGQCIKAQTRAEQAEQDAADAEQAEERTNAAQACDAERGETAESRKAFEEQYGTNANKKNAFGKCVSQKAKEDDEDDAS